MRTGAPVRVLIVHPSDELYGADRVLLEVLKAFPQNCEIEVWLPTDVEYPLHKLSTAIRAAGVTVRHLDLPVLRRAYAKPKHFLGLARRFITAGSEVRRARPHLVYVNTSALAPVLLLARLSGARTVLHMHELLDRLQFLSVSPFFRWAGRVIAVSAAVQRSLPASVRRRSVVVHNGFDLRDAVAPLPGDKLRFIVASRWNSWKGHETLLRAWNDVDTATAELFILGAEPPSGDSVDVRALVSRLRHPESVTIVGEVDDVRGALDEAHVVIVPSIRPDPLPTIAIEALAAGRPVIASECGGLPEIVGVPNSGWLTAPGDATALCQVISKVSMEDVVKMSGSARMRFDLNFTLDTFLRNISSVLLAEVDNCERRSS